MCVFKSFEVCIARDDWTESSTRIVVAFCAPSFDRNEVLLFSLGNRCFSLFLFFLYELYTKYRITDYITIYKRRIYINFDRGRRFETREELATNRRYSDDCFLPSYEFVYSWEDWLEKKKRTRDFIFILDPFSSSTEPRTNFQPNGATRIIVKRKDNETDAWF